MDNSRDADLEALHDRYNDPKLPMSARQRAYHQFQDIQIQAKDKKLTALRARLIGAIKANDIKEVEKIEMQIKEHRYRQTGVVSTTA